MFCHGFNFGGYGFTGYGFGGPAMMLILIILTVLGIVYFVSRNNQNKNATAMPEYGKVSPSVNAVDILNERFAKGEINQEEYQSMKREILK